jgi:hypothetical protein
MNYQEKSWFNQILLHHKDTFYGTNGNLEISMSSNTSDYKTYSSVTLNFSITNEKIRKVYSINFQNALDLNKAFKGIYEDESNFVEKRPVEVVRKYYSDKAIKFGFLRLNNDKVVAISIVNSSSDFTNIIIQSNVFECFLFFLKSFITDYLKLNCDFTSKFILSELLEQNKMLKDGIKSIPSSIINGVGNNGIGKCSPELIEADEQVVNSMSEMELTLNDLDKFLGENLSNIIIPEIAKIENEKIIEKSVELLTSDFVKNVLKGKLVNLENIMSSCSSTPFPSLCFGERVMNESASQFELLPGIEADELKSLAYLSKSFYNNMFFRYLDDGVPIPAGIPLLKYMPKSSVPENISLAYDLLLISSYIKVLRSKLEMKERDCQKNKSLFHMSLRLFTDIYSFSFLELISDKLTIKNCITERFRQYDQNGFFDDYKKILSDYRLDQVTCKEIEGVVDEIKSKVIGTQLFVTEVHNQYYSNAFLLVSSKNNLNLEQITETLNPLQSQIYKKKINPKNKELLISFIESNYDVKNESIKPVIDIIKNSGVDSSAFRKVKERETNILKISKFYINDIPEKYKADFIEHVRNFKDENFDFSDSNFPIEEFNEPILKAIYIWNMYDKSMSYADFVVKIENTSMSKDLILSKYRAPIVVSEEVKVNIEDDDFDWDSLTT